jgi:hypothetical protein
VRRLVSVALANDKAAIPAINKTTSTEKKMSMTTPKKL